MGRIKERFKIELNNSENVRALLQETYDEACKNLVDIETQMNKLQNSVSLNDEAMDAKTKYAKAMNDFIANRDRALQKKMDIARLMAEIIKNESKNAEVNFTSESLDWDALKSEELSKEEYRLK